MRRQHRQITVIGGPRTSCDVESVTSASTARARAIQKALKRETPI
ncbi:hypothetical protein BRPE64_BCDS06780 [Caballeronia insecticola]|uniref:Uncharacterized protein n=1 Tax=Caballeronia insecticola TaxID=758793 RepID=R4WLJ1_9BURK|nr:hypothetical protein BRPE64_BCDS06780 [Caballeronia insecticola]